MPPKNTSLTKEQLLKQYNNILVALQGLYHDCHTTVDRQSQLESELQDIKKLLIQLLKYQKSLLDFETKVFRKNLET